MGSSGEQRAAREGEGTVETPFTHRADGPTSLHDAGPLTEDLRRVLRTELLRDSCSAAMIAQLFSMHRRTMSRHLRMEGLAFRQVANEVRFEIACELLENTDMALSQVAAALKYSELSAFTRAFRRWSGQTPSAWRRSHPRIRKPRFRKPRRLRPGPGGRSNGSNDLS
ncbi:helix-turn-helix domain-containing protein [Microvirga sp. CF3016]|uniref:helix-turn-helix domain-containing protein n=1 Tax=Microvirga sp. CF3016 TaxID=3110181 RepID=UPI002E7962F7|nr:AraC family transcriptional regulator [Microvirga sp. CF3016]MEE1609790.1 AraC family transcriptional regulator [Microvirga sp. CF3016]